MKKGYKYYEKQLGLSTLEVVTVSEVSIPKRDMVQQKKLASASYFWIRYDSEIKQKTKQLEVRLKTVQTTQYSIQPSLN